MADGDELDSLSSVGDLLLGPDDETTFDAPWQARTFGIAVALLDEDAVDRERFRAQVRKRHGGIDGGQVDYRRWLGALEEATVEAGLLSREEIASRKSEFSIGHRDASEFVVEDRPR